MIRPYDGKPPELERIDWQDFFNVIVRSGTRRQSHGRLDGLVCTNPTSETRLPRFARNDKCNLGKALVELGWLFYPGDGLG